MRITPGQVDGMPFQDALSLWTALLRDEERQMEWQAAIHNIKLK